MKILVIIILSFLTVAACRAQQTTKLPPEMPANITIYFNQSGGMMRAYTRVTIDEGVLDFEELKGGQKDARKWSARVSSEDLRKLYRTFVAQKFDAVKNDRREGIVYDAGSESISISLDKRESFGVTYGKNSPLSGGNLERYQAVRKALFDLVARLQNKATTNDQEAENFIEGTWRVAGTNGNYAWFLQWTFAGGEFKQTGYPPIVQTGKYRVASSETDKLRLVLYEQSGTFGANEREIEITVDRAKRELTIERTAGFKPLAAQ